MIQVTIVPLVQVERVMNPVPEVFENQRLGE
jgi:hypothetical protein